MADTSSEMSNEKLADKIVNTFFKEIKRERRLKYFRIALMTVFFAASMLVYVVFNSGSPLNSMSASQQTYRVIRPSEDVPVSSNAKLATIAVLPIRGTIDGDMLGESSSPNMVAKVRNALKAIEGEKNKNLAALVLYIDSPGGTVTASDELYRMILEWKQKHKVQVVAYFHAVAASGGYYIAQSADEIIADETVMTGSIGVIMSALNFTELARKVGVTSEVIKSGEFKDIGSSFRAMTPQERQILQAIIGESYERFLSVIVEGRKGLLTKDEIRKLADGRIWSGKQAKALKLVDASGTFDELLMYETKRVMKERSELVGAKAVVYSIKEDSFLGGIFSKLSFSASIFPIDERMRRPQLMYLWLGGL